MAKVAVMVEITQKASSADESDFRVFGFGNNEQIAEGLARYALENNQWAEIATLMNEKLNAADWRAEHVVETF